MSFPTTISLTARVDMQDSLARFVTNKQWPAVRVRWGDQSREHRFTRPDEQHRFTMTARLPRGEHDLTLEFMERTPVQGAVEIVSLHCQGTPMGLEIYRCEYTTWETDSTEQSHLYMGRPGVWRLRLGVPRGGAGFV